MIRYPKASEAELARRQLKRLQALRSLLTERIDAALHQPGANASSVLSAISATRAAFQTVMAPTPAALLPVARALETVVTQGVLQELKRATSTDYSADQRLKSQAFQLERARVLWAGEVATYIAKNEAEYLDRVTMRVTAAMAEGRSDAIKATLKEESEASGARAQLIARDQVGNLTARVSEARLVALGIDRYRWTSRGDEKVRASHRKLAGTVQRWSDPPAEGHPGQAIACRCMAVPVVEDEPAELPAPRPAPAPVPPKPAPLPAVPARPPAPTLAPAAPAHTPLPAPTPPPVRPAPLDLKGGRGMQLFHGLTPQERNDALVRIFGRTVEPEEILRWGGVEQGDIDEHPQVYMQVHGTTVDLQVQSTRFKMDRRYTRSSVTGELVAYHESLEVQDTGKGLGARIFGRQVDALRQAGFARIDTFAAGHYGSDEFNGYWTWARFGFDGNLPTRISSKLPPDLQEAKTVSDLMMTADGRDWWEKNGKSMDMSFSLDPTSRSSKAFESYLASKKKRSDAEEIDLDEEDERILDEVWDQIARDEGIDPRPKAEREQPEA